jgi:hypothetical protein
MAFDLNSGLTQTLQTFLAARIIQSYSTRDDLRSNKWYGSGVPVYDFYSIRGVPWDS